MREYACQILLLLLHLANGRAKSQHLDPAFYANLHSGPLLAHHGLAGHPQNVVPDYYYDDVIVPNPHILTKPEVHHINEEKANPNANYQFAYGVADPEHGTQYSRTESANGKGTTGQYQVALPDGRIQTVKYTADENGYRADVTYEGEAVYDEAPHPSSSPHREAKSPVAQLAHLIPERRREPLHQNPIPSDHGRNIVEVQHQRASLHRDAGRHVQFLEHEPNGGLFLDPEANRGRFLDHQSHRGQFLEYQEVNRGRSLRPQIYHEEVVDEPHVVTTTPFFDGGHLSGPTPILNNFIDPQLERSFYVTSPTTFNPIGPAPPFFNQNSLHANLTPTPHPLNERSSISQPFGLPASSGNHHGTNNFGPIRRPHPIIQAHSRAGARTPFEVPIFRTDTNKRNRLTRGTDDGEYTTSAPIY